MIPLLLSILFGLGVYLLYSGLTAPRRPVEERRQRRFQEFLVRAGLREVTPAQFLLVAVSAGLLLGAVSYLLLGWIMVSILAAFLGLAAPFLYYARRYERRQAVLQTALVESIGQMRDAIRSGLAVPEALAGLARTGPESIRPEFSRLVREMRLNGLETAMRAMQDRLADPLFDMVTEALVLNDRLGGRNVSQVLDRLVYATHAQLRVQDELRAAQSKTVMAARVVAAVPLVVLVGIRQVYPRYLAIFNDLPGQLLLAGCLMSIVIGYAGMLWMTRLPGEERVLR